MITDEMLRLAAAELAGAIDESFPDSAEYDHFFSPRFERRMKRVTRKANHPVLYKTLRTVACFLLIFLIGFGSVMSFNAEARDSVLGWIKQARDGVYEYFFEDESASAGTTDYCPGWMPKDCSFVTSYETGGGRTYIYKDSDNTLIQFSYINDPDGASLGIFTEEDCEVESAEVNGRPAEIYLEKKDNATNDIVWKDESGNVLFTVSGDFDKETLIKIAKNVREKNLH